MSVQAGAASMPKTGGIYSNFSWINSEMETKCTYYTVIHLCNSDVNIQVPFNPRAILRTFLFNLPMDPGSRPGVNLSWILLKARLGQSPGWSLSRDPQFLFRPWLNTSLSLVYLCLRFANPVCAVIMFSLEGACFFISAYVLGSRSCILISFAAQNASLPPNKQAVHPLFPRTWCRTCLGALKVVFCCICFVI